ncbi:MAG: peptidoglycan DD-metalloendopeptidase family protein [Amphritea sp.]
MMLNKLNTLFAGAKALFSHLPPLQRGVLVAASLLILLALLESDESSAISTPMQLSSGPQSSEPQSLKPQSLEHGSAEQSSTVLLPLEKKATSEQSVSQETAETEAPTGLPEPEPESQLTYVVQQGDTLSTIFDFLRISQPTLYKLMEADLNVLALDTIQPGHELGFSFDDEQKLKQFIFKSGLTYKVLFERSDNKGFEFKELIEKGELRSEVFSGTVKGTLHQSMQSAGTTLAEAYSVTGLLKERINFRKHLRAGDQFQVVLTRQYVDGQYTGSSKVEGFVYAGQVRDVSAFLFGENYFDAKGESLEKAFQRIPLKKRYRISSHFNPKRKHPITGLIRPHNGTDFPLRIGTPVLAAGDGVVSRVVRHRYAGLYIEIKHGQKYKTRYLHLSKAYIRKGQKVSRGQKIAASGNSGRSTGAHLHYELHANNRPVNAMKAPIPVVQTIARSKRNAFKQRVAALKTQMTEQLALAEKQAAES